MGKARCVCVCVFVCATCIHVHSVAVSKSYLCHEGYLWREPRQLNKNETMTESHKHSDMLKFGLEQSTCHLYLHF